MTSRFYPNNFSQKLYEAPTLDAIPSLPELSIAMIKKYQTSYRKKIEPNITTSYPSPQTKILPPNS
jgi:hypothetical protein